MHCGTQVERSRIVSASLVIRVGIVAVLSVTERRFTWVPRRRPSLGPTNPAKAVTRQAAMSVPGDARTSYWANLSEARRRLGLRPFGWTVVSARQLDRIEKRRVAPRCSGRNDREPHRRQPRRDEAAFGDTPGQDTKNHVHGSFVESTPIDWSRWLRSDPLGLVTCRSEAAGA